MQIAEPVDALAYIGRNPQDYENVYIVTGDSGHGLTHGTIAGRRSARQHVLGGPHLIPALTNARIPGSLPYKGILIPDLILGRVNAWAELYEPSRKSLRSLPSMLAHDVEINAQYKDYFLPGDVHDIEDIPRCSGAVMRNGMRKVAVYRDEAGTVHQFSAACPHLGGIVRWNAAEKTWDCPVYVVRARKRPHRRGCALHMRGSPCAAHPARLTLCGSPCAAHPARLTHPCSHLVVRIKCRHGSRFSCYGEVVNGPAKSSLHPARYELADTGQTSGKAGHVREGIPQQGASSETPRQASK